MQNIVQMEKRIRRKAYDNVSCGVAVVVVVCHVSFSFHRAARMLLAKGDARAGSS